MKDPLTNTQIGCIGDHLIGLQVGVVPGWEIRPREAHPDVRAHGEQQADVVAGPIRRLRMGRRSGRTLGRAHPKAQVVGLTGLHGLDQLYPHVLAVEDIRDPVRPHADVGIAIERVLVSENIRGDTSHRVNGALTSIEVVRAVQPFFPMRRLRVVLETEVDRVVWACVDVLEARVGHQILRFTAERGKEQRTAQGKPKARPAPSTVHCREKHSFVVRS